MSKNQKIGLGVVLILAVVFGVLNVYKYVYHNTQDLPAAPKQALVSKTEVEPGKTPDLFPLDIPIEADAKIVQNYNAQTVDGRFQATQAFETKKTLEENLSIYTQYLENNGWSVKSTIDQPTYKAVSASKGNSQIKISITDNTTTNRKTVSISLVQTQ